MIPFPPLQRSRAAAEQQKNQSANRFPFIAGPPKRGRERSNEIHGDPSPSTVVDSTRTPRSFAAVTHAGGIYTQYLQERGCGSAVTAPGNADAQQDRHTCWYILVLRFIALRGGNGERSALTGQSPFGTREAKAGAPSSWASFRQSKSDRRARTALPLTNSFRDGPERPS